jgi:hypothetical protein
MKFQLIGSINKNDWELPDSGKIISDKVRSAEIEKTISANTGIPQESIDYEVNKYRVDFTISQIPLDNLQQIIESLLNISEFDVEVYQILNTDSINNW